MFKSSTDYSAYPTVSGLSRNDKDHLYHRPISEKDILMKFSEIEELKELYNREKTQLEKKNQEIQELKKSFSKETEQLRGRIIVLENEVKQLKEQIKQGSRVTSSVVEKPKKIDDRKTSFNHSYGIKTTRARLDLQVGQMYTMGTYGEEKIQWKVLKVEDGKALLLSEKGLDARAYNEGYKRITWENCDLRAWLNKEFIDEAFGAEEKERIVKTKIKNLKNPRYGTDGGNDTEDQVFLLSIEEAKEYFKSDKERICYPTEYAKKQGCYTSDNGDCTWWLRSPGFYTDHATFVTYYGCVDDYGYHVYRIHNYGCRPALWIHL